MQAGDWPFQEHSPKKVTGGSGRMSQRHAATAVFGGQYNAAG